MSCQAGFDQAITDSSLVVEGYIFENKPVENIKLSLVDPIISQTTSLGITDAEVFIFWNGFYFKLNDATNTGLFSAENSNLKIIAGETYELIIRYNGKEYEAVTTVPEPPIQLEANKDTLFINSASDAINVNWSNQDSLWFLGVIAEQNPKATDFPFNNFFSIPTQGASLEITPNDVQNIGNKQFILFGITDAYEELYRISNSSIGSSYDGNLSNGFGIFTAFSSDTLNIVVSDK